MVDKVNPCNLTEVKRKRYTFFIAGFLFLNTNRWTVEKRIKITESYYKNGDSAVSTSKSKSLRIFEPITVSIIDPHRQFWTQWINWKRLDRLPVFLKVWMKTHSGQSSTSSKLISRTYSLGLSEHIWISFWSSLCGQSSNQPKPTYLTYDDEILPEMCRKVQ